MRTTSTISQTTITPTSRIISITNIISSTFDTRGLHVEDVPLGSSAPQLPANLPKVSTTITVTMEAAMVE